LFDNNLFITEKSQLKRYDIYFIAEENTTYQSWDFVRNGIVRHI